MSFNPNMLTEKAAQVFSAAVQAAQQRGHSQVMPAHLALALLEDKTGLTANILTRAGGNTSIAQQEIGKVLQKQASQQPPPSPTLSQSLHAILQEADKLKLKQDDAYISVDHLLLAVITAKEVIAAFSVSKSAIEEAVKSVRGTRKVTSKTAENSYEALSKYATDLTALAEQGKLDPVIGRDDEIRRVIGL